MQLVVQKVQMSPWAAWPLEDVEEASVSIAVVLPVLGLVPVRLDPTPGLREQ